MSKQCIVCGSRYGREHLPTCPRFQPTTRIDKLQAQLTEAQEAIAKSISLKQFNEALALAEKTEQENKRLREALEEIVAFGKSTEELPSDFTSLQALEVDGALTECFSIAEQALKEE